MRSTGWRKRGARVSQKWEHILVTPGDKNVAAHLIYATKKPAQSDYCVGLERIELFMSVTVTLLEEVQYLSHE